MTEKRGELDSSLANKLVLKKAVEHKIRQVSEKAFVSEKEVYDLIRGFFKKYISIDYEFTSEELMREMRKIYLPGDLPQRVKALLDKIAEIEHLTRTFSKEELLKILEDFRGIVDAMITTHYENKSIFTKVMDALHLTSVKNVMPDDVKLLNENERMVVKMNMLLDNGRRYADKDVAAAKSSYEELMVLYNNLDPERKVAYFRPVSELYALLKNKGI